MKKKILMAFTALVLTLTGMTSVSAETTISVSKNTKMTHVDANSNSSLDFGEEVCIGKECFYVIQVNEEDNTVDLLAKYNLKVGNAVVAYGHGGGISKQVMDMQTSATGIQAETSLGGYETVQSGDQYEGTVEYNETKLQGYVDSYVSYLSTEYGVTATGSIMDANILNIFNCDVGEGQVCLNNPEWFKSTSYWLHDVGSSYAYAIIRERNESVEEVSPKKSLEVTNNWTAGVRPVITTDVDLFDSYLINVEEPDNGTLEVKGTDNQGVPAITITAVPDDGFELDVLEVTDLNGNDLEIIDNGDGTYTVNNINSNLSVNVAFKEVADTDESKENIDNNKTEGIENPETSDNIVVAIATSVIALIVLVGATSYLKRKEN